MTERLKNHADSTTDSLSGQLVPIRRRVNLQVSYHAGETPGIVFIHGGLGNRFNWR